MLLGARTLIYQCLQKGNFLKSEQKWKKKCFLIKVIKCDFAHSNIFLNDLYCIQMIFHDDKEGLFMATNVKKQEVQVEDQNSLKGTLFSTIVFVGGGILFFIVLLFYFYMTRV